MPNFYQKRQKLIHIRNIEMTEKEDKWEQFKNLPNTYTDIKVWERIEMNDSELALTQAKLNFNQAIYDYMVAKADLEKVLGQQEF